MNLDELHILTDEQLLPMAQEGSETAAEILIEKYKGFVRQKAKAYFIVGADSDDVIQEGMIGLYKAIISFNKEREANFKTYAGVCVTNQILNAIKAAEREKNQPLNESVSLNTPEGEDSKGMNLSDRLKGSNDDEPEKKVLMAEIMREIQDPDMEIFSSLERQVLAYKLAGYGYKEIADKLGKTPKTIDNAAQRLKRKITDYLEK